MMKCQKIHPTDSHSLHGPLLLAVLLLTCSISLAGELQLGTPRIADTLVRVPVVLQPGTDTGVAGLDFTFAYDPDVFDLVSARPSTSTHNARKEVTTNLIEPGQARIVLTGINRETLAGGTVATLELQRKTLQSGESTIEINDTTFTSLDAQELPSQGDAATLRWNGDDIDVEPATPSLPDEPSEESEEDDPTTPSWDAAMVDTLGTGEQAATEGGPSDGSPDDAQRIDSALGRASELRQSLEDPAHTPGNTGLAEGSPLEAESDALEAVPVPRPNLRQPGLAEGVAASGLADARTDPDAMGATVPTTPIRAGRQPHTLMALIALAVGIFLLMICYRMRGWLKS